MMLYREAGQFKSTYAADQQIFPIRQDRIAIGAPARVAFVVVPLVGDQYWLARDPHAVPRSSRSPRSA